MQKYVRETGDDRHGNHPKYNDWLRILLDEKLDEYETQPHDPCKAKKMLENLIDSLRSIISNSTKKINDIGIEQLQKIGK